MTTIISSKSAKITAGLVGLVAGIAMFAITAQAATFTTNLKQGSTGADVKNLQLVLNMSADTQVATTGAGSPGNETSYFGPATKAAVIKFQNKHASEILAPVGLTAGTGYVGPSTRAMLNGTSGSTVGSTTTVPGCTSTVGFSPTTGQSCATGAVTTTTTTSSGPISASLANDNPAASAVVAGQATADLLHVAFTGNGTITNVKLLRTGISSNTALSNVYLFNGNSRVSDSASVNNTDGSILFNGLNIAVNGSLTLSVKADILSSVGGQIVGVTLTGFTTTGNAMTTTNIAGNYMSVATQPTMTAVTAAANSVGATATVNAGTTGFTFWSSAVTITNRTGILKGANFKYIGSAPADALQNVRLYVNGSAVGPTGVLNTVSNLLSFDFGSSPVTLNTGVSTIEVRADVVKGSNRTITISLPNAADLIVMDSQLGVNIAVTNNSSTGTTVTVNAGSVTTSVDSSFNATTVAGGTTSATLGQYKMKAYGEDVKVDSLKVTFATSSSVYTLDNIAVFANGSQVGSSANFLGTAALSFSLGSSLILPANQEVTITIKGDVINSSGTAYSAGTIAAVLSSVEWNGTGQSSSETITVVGTTGITGNTLTVGSGAGTFTRTSGFVTATTSPNTSGVKIGSFTLQAGSSEGIKVNSIGVKPAIAGFNGGTDIAITNYTTLTVKNGTTVLGNPIGNPTTATSTFSFSDISLPVNGSVTFDVYADIGSSASSTANPTITADMSVSYRGNVSNTTTVSSAAGVAVASASATLSAPTLVASSPVAQFVVGGSTMGIATFKLKTAAAGTSANVNELRFTTMGTDAITSITVGGVTKNVTGSGAGATTTVSGLNINVPFTGVDVPVTVKFSQFLDAGTPASTSGLTSGIASVKITLGHIQGTSGTGAAITSVATVDSNTMKLYASKPTVSGPSTASGSLTTGIQKIGEFTIGADVNGKIALATTSVKISTSTTGTMTVSNVMLSDDGGATAITNSNTQAVAVSGTAFDLGFTTAYEISAGASKTFSIYANVTGAYSASNTSIATQLNSTLASTTWNDVVSGSTGLTAAGIQNFGVSAYTLKNY